jgi:hypothetical protein
MQGNAFNTSLNAALSNRNTGLAAMQAYQPLQTGQAQTTSGLGTWLPQVAGMAMNALMPGVDSMMGGGSFSGGYQGNPYNGQAARSTLSAAQAGPPAWNMPQTQTMELPSTLPYS